jgi:hypothetical protein
MTRGGGGGGVMCVSCVCVCVCVLLVYVVGEACTLFIRTDPAFSINTHNELTMCILPVPSFPTFHSPSMHPSSVLHLSPFI